MAIFGVGILMFHLVADDDLNASKQASGVTQINTAHTDNQQRSNNSILSRAKMTLLRNNLQ